MRKLVLLGGALLLLLLLVAAFALSSCVSGDEAAPSDFGGDAVPVSYRWATDKGTYFTSTSLFKEGALPRGADFKPDDIADFIGDPLLLYINDALLGEDIVLCNRPNCPHDGIDCNAYLPYDDYYESHRKDDIRHTSVIFVDGQHVYAHNGGSRIFRFNLDGAGRVEAALIPSMYLALHGGWLMNGKFYAQTEYFTTEAAVKVLLEIDYVSGECREVWGESKKEEHSASDIIAVMDERAFGVQRIYPRRYTSYFASDEQKLEFHDSTEYRVFYVDLADDEARVNIVREGMEREFNPCLSGGLSGGGGLGVDLVGKNPSIYYHSRRDEAVYRLDLISGESVKIADNIPGTMQLRGAFGGLLFMVDFMVDHNCGGNRIHYDLATGLLVDRNENLVYKEMLFLDLATGEMQNSAIVTKRTATGLGYVNDVDGGYYTDVGDGFTEIGDGFTDVIYEEGGFFYIEIERVEKEIDVWGDGRVINIELDRHLIGRIPIMDYRLGNAEAIERLSWVSAEEFIAMHVGAVKG